MNTTHKRSLKSKATHSSNREQQLLIFAREAAAKAESWIDLHNAVFGIGGKMAELFPDRADRARLVKSAEYRAVVGLIEEAQGEAETLAELLATASGKLLIRTPRSVHAALLAEAAAEGVSLNQLCLSKLCIQLRAAV